MKEEIDFNKVYQKIQDLLSKGAVNISVLEDQVDVQLQMEYFNHSKKNLKKIDREAFVEEVGMLQDANVSTDSIKDLLSGLAKIDNPKAYRAIESYKEIAEGELRKWATLALQESKMVLETSLLGEAPIFISTGLGGCGDMLRYFVVLIGSEDIYLKEWQQDLVKKELASMMKYHNGVLEEVSTGDDKVLITSLLPMSVNVKEAYEKVVDECNELGGFLMQSFIVTNVKKLGAEEINKMVNHYRSSKEDE